MGVLAGIAVGWVLARVAFRSRARSLRVAETGEPLMALAALLLAYGASEVVGGYGFLAVFACAMTLRSAERTHEYHALMHQVVERLERLLTLIVLLFVGIGLTHGLLANLDVRGVVLGLALVFVIRPLSAWAALAVGRRGVADRSPDPLEHRERLVTAFFGVRGVGTFYYLAYAFGQADVPGAAVALVDGRLRRRGQRGGPRHRRHAGDAAPGAAPGGRPPGVTSAASARRPPVAPTAHRAQHRRGRHGDQAGQAPDGDGQAAPTAGDPWCRSRMCGSSAGWGRGGTCPGVLSTCPCCAQRAADMRDGPVTRTE